MNSEIEKTPPNLRILALLTCLSKKGTAMTLTDFVRDLGWAKQTTHRLLHLMVDEGLLVRSGRFFSPSRQMASIANGLLQYSPSHIMRRKILQDLAQESGETVNFVMPHEDGMTYVDRIETNWAFRILLPVGSHVPFHCTASGKTYLANIRSSQRQKLVSTLSLDRHTKSTITQAEQLQSELKTIRKRGVALDDEEFIDNMLAIAVPIFDDEGRYYASLAIHGPKQRFAKDTALSMEKRLKECSALITSCVFTDPA